MTTRTGRTAAVALAALLAVAATVEAQIKAYTIANLPVSRCEGGELLNKMYLVTDATGASCSVASGSDYVLCVCVPGTPNEFVPLTISSTDLSGYVPTTKAGQQAAAATGAGNDFNISAADDVVVNVNTGGVTKSLTTDWNGSSAIRVVPNDEMVIGPTAGSEFMRLTSTRGIVLEGTGEVSVTTVGGLTVADLFDASDVGSGGASPDENSFYSVSDEDGLMLASGNAAPSAANDSCNAGRVAFSATFFYYCIATDTWVRAALSTW